MEAQHPLHPRRNVRLDTLVRLRWLAVGGQTAAVLVVHYVFDFTLPLTACLLVIGCSAALNLALRLRFRPIERLEPDRAAWLLAFDIVQLASLLYLTGGVENPFVFLFLGPVLIAATALPPRMTLMLGALAAACATALVFFHLPLPWVSDEPRTRSAPRSPPSRSWCASSSARSNRPRPMPRTSSCCASRPSAAARFSPS